MNFTTVSHQKLSMPKVDVSLPRKKEFVFLVLPFKLTNVYLPEFSNCINRCLTRSGMFYVPSIQEVLKSTLRKKEKIGVFVPDVDISDGPDFRCDDLVVEGEPEPLEADLVLEDDSDVEIVRGVFSS